jgi:prepilin-type N-terminal cleavage/methylation domain-containing protein
MKRKQNKNGLTIVEILVVIAIVAMLAAGLYSVSNYVDTQAKIKHTETTIETLAAALAEYHDFYGKFPFEADENYDRGKLEANDKDGLDGTVSISGGVIADYNDLYASSEALYHFLNKCPSSRKIVNSINISLITNKDNRNKEYFFEFKSDAGKFYPLRHIIDSWKTPLRYTYKPGNNFPVITSAGPDKDFGDTNPGKKADNINSR